MAKQTKKHRCSKCNNMATWVYLPSSHGRIFFCDDCVSRGCTCNVLDLGMEEPNECLKDRTVWWSKETYGRCLCDKVDAIDYATMERQPDSYHYEILDEKGRREPCIEFDYSKTGYEFEGNFYVVDYEDITSIYKTVTERYEVGTKSMLEGMERIIMEYENETEIPYNQFMSKIATFCRPYTILTMFEHDRLNNKIYNSFRGQVYDRKYNIVYGKEGQTN